jgi:hypothetical protein
MKPHFTFGRVVGAIAFSLLFILQAIGNVMNGHWTLTGGLVFALVLSAFCFLVVLSHRGPSDVAIPDGRGDAGSRHRWPPLWAVLVGLWLIWQLWVFFKSR